MTCAYYKQKIEEYCIDREKKGVTPIFTVRWIIAINHVSREEVPEGNRAIRKLHREEKIKKYGGKTWQWVWREIKGKIEAFCKEKYTKTGIPPIFNKKNIIYHLKLNEEEAERLRQALVTLLKEGKIVKYGRQTYRWHGI